MKQFTYLVLTGMKHTGKSTLGALLAGRLGLPFFDTDAVIGELSGKTPRALYDEGGADLMMREETAACRSLMASGRRAVIATGGGIADNPEAMAILREKGLCIYIDTPFDLLFARVMESARRDGRLPRFLQDGDPETLFREFYARRSAIYATMADMTVSAGSRTPEELTLEIMDYINGKPDTDLHS